jgi:hypothetical protein
VQEAVKDGSCNDGVTEAFMLPSFWIVLYVLSGI